MEDPATVAASAASVVVEATEAVPVELRRVTVLHRLPPVVRSPVRSVRTYPDSSAGMFPELFLARSATTCPGRSAGTCQDSNVTTSPASSARPSPGSSAPTCPDRRVRTSQTAVPDGPETGMQQCAETAVPERTQTGV